MDNERKLSERVHSLEGVVGSQGKAIKLLQAELSLAQGQQQQAQQQQKQQDGGEGLPAFSQLPADSGPQQVR